MINLTRITHIMPRTVRASPRRVIQSRKVRQNLNYLNAEPASWGIT